MWKFSFQQNNFFLSSSSQALVNIGEQLVGKPRNFVSLGSKLDFFYFWFSFGKLCQLINKI